MWLGLSNQTVDRFKQGLTILLDPGGGGVLRHNHLTELVSYEAEDVFGCGLVQLALVHQPGNPKGQGFVVKLVRIGEAVHPDDSVFTVGQPGREEMGYGQQDSQVIQVLS